MNTIIIFCVIFCFVNGFVPIEWEIYPAKQLIGYCAATFYDDSPHYRNIEIHKVYNEDDSILEFSSAIVITYVDNIHISYLKVESDILSPNMGDIVMEQEKTNQVSVFRVPDVYCNDIWPVYKKFNNFMSDTNNHVTGCAKRTIPMRLHANHDYSYVCDPVFIREVKRSGHLIIATDFSDNDILAPHWKDNWVNVPIEECADFLPDILDTESDTQYWHSYPIEKMINKCAIRKNPTKIHKDYSFTDEPVFIGNVWNDKIKIKAKFNEIYELDNEWLDENWVIVPPSLCS